MRLIISPAGSPSAHLFVSGHSPGKNMSGKKSVLIIEDALPQREYLCASLTADGFTVDCCDNATSALAVAAERDFQIIITDYRLPNMNGVDMTRLLRLRFPLAIIIGLSSADKKADFLAAGANAFLHKPYRYHNLLNVINRQLSNSPFFR